MSSDDFAEGARLRVLAKNAAGNSAPSNVVIAVPR